MSFVDARGEGDLEDEDLLGGDELEPVTEEERARAMGWKPLPADPRNPQPNEYRGDPRRWTDAATFIAHGEEELPILRDQNRRMSERLARTDGEIVSLKGEIETQRQAVRDAVNLAKRADERGYQRGLAELQERRRELVAAGDTEGFDAVQEQIDAMEQERAQHVEPEPTSPPPPPPPPPPGPQIAPEITQFISDNPWFNDKSRDYLRQAMIAAHNKVIAQHPDMPVAEQLDQALDAMEAAYPEIVGDEMRPAAPPAPRRRAPSALPPSGPIARRRTTNASPIDAIADADERKEARAAFESIRRGDPGMTEAEYMAIYDDPHADAVALRNQRKK